MIKARDIMTKNPITVSPDMEIVRAAKIVGILCQSDLIAQQKNLPIPSVFTLLDGFIPLSSTRHLEKTVRKIAATNVRDAMTTDPVTVHPDTGIEEIARLMLDKNFHTLPVVEGGKLVGVIGQEDVLRTLMPGQE